MMGMDISPLGVDSYMISGLSEKGRHGMREGNVFVSNRKTSPVDVAIVGGGPAGSSLAILLAQNDLSVVVIDASTGGVWKVGESIPPSATPVLKGLGIWEAFVRDEHLPYYGNRIYWGSDEPRTEDFLSDGGGWGWHLDRNHFERMLAIHARKCGACYWPHTKVLAFERNKNHLWQLSLTSREKHWQIETRFVVDATGRKSWLAQGLGIRRQSHDKLVALVVYLAGARWSSHRGIYDRCRHAGSVTGAAPQGMGSAFEPNQTHRSPPEAHAFSHCR